MEPLLDLTNHAAAQNDRWLFIGSLIVLGCFAVYTMRYFVRQHERLIADHQRAREDWVAGIRGQIRISVRMRLVSSRRWLVPDNSIEFCGAFLKHRHNGRSTGP